LGVRWTRAPQLTLKMKHESFLSPEELWDAILSRDIPRILETWRHLNEAEQSSLLAHLERMVGEAGWHPEQVTSARCALDTIRALTARDRNDPQ
jgi:hypothetical protein